MLLVYDTCLFLKHKTVHQRFTFQSKGCIDYINIFLILPTSHHAVDYGRERVSPSLLLVESCYFKVAATPETTFPNPLLSCTYGLVPDMFLWNGGSSNVCHCPAGMVKKWVFLSWPLAFLGRCQYPKRPGCWWWLPSTWTLYSWMGTSSPHQEHLH